jgi:CBS domain-containing membrane protein
MTRQKSPDHNGSPVSRFRLFNPLLAGATLRERAIACIGALVGIALTGFVSGLLLGNGPHLPLIVAPIGASAVLLFAVPNSPLAQPWSIIGGNTISALVGVIVARYVSDPALAIGLGVALAIAAMSVTRSLHPPGGAAALTAVLGGQAVASWGLWFPVPQACPPEISAQCGGCTSEPARDQGLAAFGAIGHPGRGYRRGTEHAG